MLFVLVLELERKPHIFLKLVQIHIILVLMYVLYSIFMWSIFIYVYFTKDNTFILDKNRSVGAINIEYTH